LLAAARNIFELLTGLAERIVNPEVWMKNDGYDGITRDRSGNPTIASCERVN
jgi:hypothetical protein